MITLNNGDTWATFRASLNSNFWNSLDKTLNLSDVANTATARNNLGLGSIALLSSVNLTSNVTGILPVWNWWTWISSLGTWISTWLWTPSSANLLAAMTDETGSWSLVFATNPSITSPTLTTPKISSYIADTNGNEVIIIPATASAVNEVTITNAATWNSPTISPSWWDTNIDLTLSSKWTWEVKIGKWVFQDINSATDGATVTFDLSLSNYHRVTLWWNRTLALSNAKIWQRFIIDLIQDGTWSRTVTWFTTIKWAWWAAPTLTTTINKIDTLWFICTSSGNYQGYIIWQNI